MGSSRFPGKPMANILGKPMIGHVYERVRLNPQLMSTVVATCDREIADYIESIGGQAVMTGFHHKRASDRCSEALEILEDQINTRYDIIVMVQGDEPMIRPEMISQVVQPMLENQDILITNLMGKIEKRDEFNDPNCVKVVCDQKGNALYFSREPIPTSNKMNDFPMNKQYGVISFRRNFLLEYTKMPPTPLEIIESVDMLRLLEHGLQVQMILTNYNIYTVDTPEELDQVEKLMKHLPSL